MQIFPGTCSLPCRLAQCQQLDPGFASRAIDNPRPFPPVLHILENLDAQLHAAGICLPILSVTPTRGSFAPGAAIFRLLRFAAFTVLFEVPPLPPGMIRSHPTAR